MFRKKLLYFSYEILPKGEPLSYGQLIKERGHITNNLKSMTSHLNFNPTAAVTAFSNVEAMKASKVR